MEINGRDIVIETTVHPVAAVALAAAAIRQVWPTSTHEAAETGKCWEHPWELPRDGIPGNDLFVYVSHYAYVAWTDGTEEDGPEVAMINLIGDDGALTVVVGDPEEPATKRILEAIRGVLTANQGVQHGRVDGD